MLSSEKHDFSLYKKLIASARNFVLDAAIGNIYICSQKSEVIYK